MKRQYDRNDRQNHHHDHRHQTVEMRTNTVHSLLKLIQYDEVYNICNTFFGYIVGITGIPLHERIAIDLKTQFTNIQELYYGKILSQESIAFMVVDAIENYKKNEYLNERERYSQLLNLFQYNIEETMTNERFVYQKWEVQERKEREVWENEQAIKLMMEEDKSQNKMKAQEAESQGWECQVCYTDIDRNNFGLLECGHIFHPECINAYLKSKIESNEIDISCPMEGCPKHLDVGDIYGFVDKDLRQKFEKFSFNRFVERNGASTAWCPTAGCPTVYEFDEHLDNYRCPACHKHYCLNCRCEYHIGMSCAQYKINNSFDKNDQDFINYVQGAKYKQCPKCKFWVQRNDGCSTMTCKCGQQFCYECGGTTCPHGSCANIGARPPARPPAVVPVRPARPMPFIPAVFRGRKKR